MRITSKSYLEQFIQQEKAATGDCFSATWRQFLRLEIAQQQAQLLIDLQLTLSSSDSMRRQPQVKAGCCSSATCSSLLAKAAIRLLLTSPFMALYTRDRNMGDLPDLAASGCSSTAYNALQHNVADVMRKYACNTYICACHLKYSR